MIEVTGLSKSFGKKEAAKDVTFRAEPGALTYLLGPNGAGKTTVLRMIAGLSRPSSGTISINGSRLRALPDVKREISFCLGAFVRNPNHTGRQHLRWQARLAGIDTADADRVLELVGLSDVAKRPTGKYSYGMLQRLGIATALLGDPRTIVLDEPANGLDVEGTLWLRDLLTGLANEGKCLLVASHSLSEVEINASWVIIMGQGRVLSNTSRDEIVAAGTEPRRLESAYLDITRNSVEYAGTGGAR
ncbi:MULTISPECIES: ABC transporter ATP-binding protein [unclassified Gordonia (in: high G+C Gram-positive bacteria)]|uniref:ABC transporter ATP-binding protein n=1 Tax=unclassified Gordonia (in: high G+C Gram-positive bacteria) TaxID=2657482 RepID=UPI001F0CFF5B|nr:ATP-binding cassette domain-containing protein [Gordonia sp. ABSL49_1]MCH5643097.1 ATP-binding cassette domain-containing protein [Gordonia sp. ABSL49_1]